MEDWFTAIADSNELAHDAAHALDERGFVVLPYVAPLACVERLAAAYDDAVESAAGGDVKIGSASIRVNDFVNRGAEFDGLYMFPPLLAACCRVIGRPFKLSSFHARTLRAGTAAEDLHVDVPRGSRDWPLVSFIVMVDEFRPDNGATRFVPGSHRWSGTGDNLAIDGGPDQRDQVPACGPAGSVIIFNGSTWHGHGANSSERPRRSLQGAFVPRDGRAWTDFAARMPCATRARLGPLAHHVLAL